MSRWLDKEYLRFDTIVPGSKRLPKKGFFDNARLGKKREGPLQIIDLLKRGQEFDIYVERQSNLRIPYDEIAADSQVYGQMRVASVAHTLLLKLAAFHDRKGSQKGEKDERDLIRLILVAYHQSEYWDLKDVLAYFDEEDLQVIKNLPKSNQIVALAQRNVHQAKSVREKVKSVVTELIQQLESSAAPSKIKSPS